MKEEIRGIPVMMDEGRNQVAWGDIQADGTVLIRFADPALAEGLRSVFLSGMSKALTFGVVFIPGIPSESPNMYGSISHIKD